MNVNPQLKKTNTTTTTNTNTNSPQLENNGGGNIVAAGDGKVQLPSVNVIADDTAKTANGTHDTGKVKGGAGSALIARNKKGVITSAAPLTIITGGDDATAVWAEKGGKITLFEGTTVNTSGKGARALLSSGALSHISGKKLTILTKGDEAAGATAQDGGSVELTGGKLTTKGKGAFGLMSLGKDSTVTANNVELSTSGAEAHGAIVSDGSKLTITGGSVTALGDKAAALHALSSSKAMNTSTATITNATLRSDKGVGITVTGPSVILKADLTGSTISGASGLLSVKDGGALNLTADAASKLTGTAVVDAKSFANLTLQNNAVWNITGNSNLTSLTLDGGTLRYEAASALQINQPLNLDARGATIDTQNLDVGLWTKLSGAGGLTKTGDGKLILYVQSDYYKGQTKVAAGTLEVIGQLGGVVTVQDKAKLGGSGRVGSLIVEKGGTAAPGNSVGTTLQAGDATFKQGSIFDVEITKDKSRTDQLVVDGEAHLLGGIVNVRLEGDKALLTKETVESLFKKNYVILTAGKMTGKFDDVFPHYNYISPSLAYTDKAVVLGFDLTPAAKTEAEQKLVKEQQELAAKQKLDSDKIKASDNPVKTGENPIKTSENSVKTGEGQQPKPVVDKDQQPKPTNDKQPPSVVDKGQQPQPANDKQPKPVVDKDQQPKPASDKQPKPVVDKDQQPKPASDKQPPSVVANGQQPQPASDKQPPSVVDKDQQPKPASDKQPPSVVANGQQPQPASDKQPPSVVDKDQQPKPVVDKDQQPKPASDKQPPSVVANGQQPQPASDKQPKPVVDKDQQPQPASDKQPKPVVDKDQQPKPASDKQPPSVVDKDQQPKPASDKQPPSVVANGQQPQPANDKQPKPVVDKDQQPKPASDKQPKPVVDKVQLPSVNVIADGKTQIASGTYDTGKTDGGAGSALIARNKEGVITSSTPLVINTGGNDASGVVAAKGGKITLSEGTTVNTSGNNARALLSWDPRSSISGENLTILTKGETADGAKALGEGLVKLTGGTVTTTGRKADGLVSYEKGSQITAEGAEIFTKGDEAVGVMAEKGGSITLTGGKVVTSGKQADGVLALDGGTINLLEGTTVEASGPYAGALSSFGSQSHISGKNLSLSTKGDLAIGAEAQEGGVVELTGGKVTTTGLYAHGLLSSRKGSRLTANGVETSTSGVDTYGVAVSECGELTIIGGSITVSGDRSAALFSQSFADMIDPNIATITNAKLRSDKGVGIDVKDIGTTLTAHLTGSTVSGASGLLSVEDGGTLNLTADAASKLTGTAVVDAKSFANLTLQNNAVWNITGNSNLTSLTLDGGTLRYEAASALQTTKPLDLKERGATIDTQNLDVLLSTKLSGAGGLTKTGDGKLILDAQSGDYKGQTKVAAGTLAVNGQLGGVVTVQDKAKLGGSGRVGTLIVEKGGTAAPGNSVGTLQAGDATFKQGSIFDVEITKDKSRTDQIAVDGEAHLLGGIVNVRLEGDKALLTKETVESLFKKNYVILTAGKMTGKFDDVFPHYNYISPSLAYTDKTVVLGFDLVPPVSKPVDEAKPPVANVPVQPVPAFAEPPKPTVVVTPKPVDAPKPPVANVPVQPVPAFAEPPKPPVVVAPKPVDAPKPPVANVPAQPVPAPAEQPKPPVVVASVQPAPKPVDAPKPPVANVPAQPVQAPAEQPKPPVVVASVQPVSKPVDEAKPPVANVPAQPVQAPVEQPKVVAPVATAVQPVDQRKAEEEADRLKTALLKERVKNLALVDTVTNNQKSVGAAIKTFDLGNPLLNTVLFSKVGEKLDYDALGGDIHASLRGALAKDSQFVRDAASDRIRAAFGDATGSKAAPVLAYGPETKRGNAVAGEAFAAVEPAASTTALWGTAYGSRNHAGTDGNAAGFSRNTGGLITGLDGVLAETWRFGLLAGYGNTSLNADRSHASVDTYQVGVYGGTKVDALTLSLGTSFAHHEISTRRKVAFGSIAETDKAEYAANTVQVFGEAAYRIDTPYAALEPFAAAAYTHLKANDFAELGGITALSGLSGTTDLTTTTLGVRASHSFVLSGTTVLTARGMAGWRHAYGDRAPDVSVALAGADGMLVAGLPLAQDTALAEAGLSFDIGKATTIGVTYTGQFSQQAHDNAVKADLTVRF
ncbi:autotransporter domain-containing protein [Phyllobacterium meliloti]|uniref:autotransporter domain-containing protein n=1 Tax=Phyllobacterium meliloti TaxID=555317 RepID=UPI001D147961|nr:autotransporter domain-containing protein [Phyllobacterium sp. T1293]UGX84743.1 autotransporter domain-containing protein [Phyllobacterium sp. T1293]